MASANQNAKQTARTVPRKFQPLLALARTWAIADDTERCEFLERATLESKRKMVQVAFPHLDALDSWLAMQGQGFPVSREVNQLRLVSQAASEALFDVYEVP